MPVSRSICDSAKAQFHSFLWLSHSPLHICATDSLSIPVDGRLSCFHGLAVVNRAAVNTEVHASFGIMVFLRYVPWSGIALLSFSQCCFNFLNS